MKTILCFMPITFSARGLKELSEEREKAESSYKRPFRFLFILLAELPKRHLMGLIEKLETLVNALLLKLGELIWKLVPLPLKKVIDSLKAYHFKLKAFIRSLPQLLKTLFFSWLDKTKKTVSSIDWKGIFVESFKKAMAQSQEKAPKNAFQKLRSYVIAPILIVAQWLQGLSGTQTLLLLTFSGASVLAVIGIGFSSQKLLKHKVTRVPASEEEVSYDRPEYYKKQTKHFEIMNFRLPVYVAEVNEIRTVDIDFTATLSNRNSKLFLEKYEFQLRDYLILQMEPSVSSFPLEEEGKEIIKQKLWSEINLFLHDRGIEGEVVELKITYVLAN